MEKSDILNFTITIDELQTIIDQSTLCNSNPNKLNPIYLIGPKAMAVLQKKVQQTEDLDFE